VDVRVRVNSWVLSMRIRVLYSRVHMLVGCSHVPCAANHRALLRSCSGSRAARVCLVNR
jgi:hypothetical protein